MQIRRASGVALLSLMLALFAAPALAQYTTTAMSGVVTDTEGNPVAGATVDIVHEPTGTRSQATTQAGGQYRAPGLRVGGPYTVTVTRSGYSGDRISDIYVTLREAYTLNVELESGTAQLDTIEVTASAISGIFSPENKGAQTVVTREEIETLPTIERSLADYVRTDPRAVIVDEERGEVSIAGQNNRYNNTTIDSVPTNDEFGLESEGLPSRRNVISIDAIQEIQVNISPYDVSQGNFVGGGINAVTKSGTNEFDGSVYYLYRDEDWVNDEPNEFDVFEEETFGVTLGGPIIEDKLFFFLSYEKFEQTEPGPNVGLRGSSAPTIFDLDPADLNRIITAAQGFGLDPGQVQSPTDLLDEDESFLAKIDWNINQNHRAQFQYLKTEGAEAQVPGRGRTAFSLGSYWYTDDYERDSFVALLFSDWSPNFSTEFNVSYADFTKQPLTRGRFPQVTVETDAGDVLFGTEQFRHANLLETQITTFYGAGEYLMGDHTLKFGLDYKNNDFFNTFVFNSLGNYTFSSIEDFENGIVDFYQLRIGNDPNDPFPAADWSYYNLGLFVQDTWDISYNFSLSYGLRVDVPNVDDDPQFNQLFLDSYGFRNDFTVDGNEVVQPRVGFNWDLSGDYAQQIRGGFGLFQGSTAGVWLSNPFTNPGGNVDVFTGFNGTPFVADPDNQPRPGGPQAARQDVDVLAPGFEQPTVWRGNLAYDRELPWGVQMTAEVVHSEVENAIQYEHLNLGDPTGVLPDGRFSYDCTPFDRPDRDTQRCNADDNFNDVLLLSNTGKGSSTLFTLELSKQWTDSLDTRVAYTVGRSDEVNPGTSSRAISNWNNRATFNPNEDVEGTANYEIQERIIGTLTWNKQFFDGLYTRVGLFYEGRSGRPYSFTFDNDANGDGISDNDLLFVPENPGDVIINDPAEEAQFFDLINNTSCLRQFRGTTVTRGHCKSEFTHQVDLRVSQEIPLFWDAKGELFFNVLNLGNLIDDDWGLIDAVPFEYVAEAVNFVGVSDDGRYIYDPTRTEFDRRVDFAAESRWSVQLGVKVRF